MKLTYSIFSVIILGLVLTFSACSKKDDPQPEIEMEEPDEALLTFTKLDNDGNETSTKVNVSFALEGHDHDHDHAHAVLAAEDDHDHDHGEIPHIHLDAGAKYRLTVTMYREETPINDEFIKAADVHQFFYTPKNSEGSIEKGFVNYTYRDKDGNGKPIGLDGTFEVLRAGEADIQVILSHGLDKSKISSGTWMYPGLAAIGGDTDMDQVFELHVGAH